MTIVPVRRVRGELFVPGDKSISHRSIMLGALASGTTRVQGFLNGADCLSTIDCFARMGIQIDVNGDSVTVYGKGMRGLSQPAQALYTGNSGTTTRLLTGLLAAQRFDSVIDGDASIRKRPMAHVKTPLELMGARIEGDFCPVRITAAPLRGIAYSLPVASAQLKSAVLLAALYAEGPTLIHEPQISRDHTERMLSHMGASVAHDGYTITCEPVSRLTAADFKVCGDISSAAFFMVAAAIVPDSQVTLRDVGINPTRTGIIDVLKQMGADMKVENVRDLGGEPVADITVSSSPLKGIRIGGDMIPRLIDELPVLAVAAAFAEGVTQIEDAQQLRVKETDRIAAVTTELARANVDATATSDGMVITGGRQVRGAAFKTYHDHRMAMSMAVLALAAHGESSIENPQVVDISFPGFFEMLNQLTA